MLVIHYEGQKFVVQDSLPEVGIHMNREFIKLALTIVKGFIGDSHSQDGVEAYTKNKIRLIRLLREVCFEHFQNKFYEHQNDGNKVTLTVAKQAIELAYHVFSNQIPL